MQERKVRPVGAHEDIPELVEHFVQKFCWQTRRDLRVSGRARELLEAYTWHGEMTVRIEESLRLAGGRGDAGAPPFSVVGSLSASLAFLLHYGIELRRLISYTAIER